MPMDVEAPPPPPDPRLTAQAQMDVNRQAARDTTQAQAINQRTPYGDLTYTQDGTWSDGTPRFTATTSLSPQAQDTVDETIGVQNKYATVAGQQLDQASDRLATPFRGYRAASRLRRRSSVSARCRKPTTRLGSARCRQIPTSANCRRWPRRSIRTASSRSVNGSKKG
jgi:hypothetical protein